MSLKELQGNWNLFGKQDPLWAIATWPDKKGNRWKLDEFFALGQKEVDEVLEDIRKLGLVFSRGRALDFGCGVGRLTQALAKHFTQVVGVDIAHSMIDLARRYNRHGSDCRYVLNEVADLRQFPEDDFDFVYSNIVLQHMEPDYSKAYIREFVRVLRPQGVVVFQLPSRCTVPPAPPTVPSQSASESDGTAGGGIKQMVKQVLPDPLLKWYRDLRYPPEPMMEMHCVEREEVERVLAAEGATVVEVKEDSFAGPGFQGFRYAAIKKSGFRA